jgi:Tfp pilus assembly protein PilE
MDAMPTYARSAGYRHRLGQAHSRVITAIFTLLEIVLVGLVIASLFAIAIASHVVSSSPANRFNASANRHADRMT